MSRDWRHGGEESKAAGSAMAPLAAPGKHTLTETLSFGDGTTAGAHGAAVQRSPGAPIAKPAEPADGMWEHTFGEVSTTVGKLGRVQAPNGVYLRVQPLPGAESAGPAINPGHKGNLHDQAWDVADALVAQMRTRGRR